MTTGKKINIDTVRRIIAEELRANVHEQVDADGVLTVTDAAAKLFSAIETFNNNSSTSSEKLLTAIDTFKQKATGPMLNAVTPVLEQLENVLKSRMKLNGSSQEFDEVIDALEQMLHAPGSYVDQVSNKKIVHFVHSDKDKLV